MPEDVHDFAWTASPDFAVVEDQWNNVHIRLLTQPYKVGNISGRYMYLVKAALARFQDWVGVYPYPNLTIVDPPMNASGACGMEYPTLITGESLWGLPNGVRLEELATVNEFGHQVPGMAWWATMNLKRHGSMKESTRITKHAL